MQLNGLGRDQVTQILGFASERLRKPDAPLDPSNRRISLIVQYLKKASADVSSAGDKEGEKEGDIGPARGEAPGEAKTKSPDEKAAPAKESSGKPAVPKSDSGKSEPKKE
jgi:chemotaxis protein MotB